MALLKRTQEKFNTPSVKLKRLLESKHITIELRNEKGQKTWRNQYWNRWAYRLTRQRTRLRERRPYLRMPLRMAAEQHGVLQNRAAMQQQSSLLKQKSEYSGILLKQLRQHLHQPPTHPPP